MSDPILDLLAAPPSPSLSVDEGAVYAGGRRRLRRRTLRRTGIGVVGIVGGAAIAFSAMGAGVSDDSTLPAGPSPAVSASSEMTPLAGGRFAIQILNTDGVPLARLAEVTDGQANEVATLPVHPDRIALDVASAQDGLMIGLVPARAVSTSFTTSGRNGSSSTTLVPMPGTKYQAVVLDFEKAFDVPEMPTALWVDDQGQVYDIDGSKAPSVTIPGTKDHAFFTHRSRQIGVVEPDGWHVKDFPSDWLPNMQTQFQQTGVWRTRAIVRVPINSPQSVSMSWDGATSESEVGILPLGDSPWAIVVGTVDGRAKLTSLTYQDEAGEEHRSAVT